MWFYFSSARLLKNRNSWLWCILIAQLFLFMLHAFSAVSRKSLPDSKLVSLSVRFFPLQSSAPCALAPSPHVRRTSGLGVAWPWATAWKLSGGSERRQLGGSLHYFPPPWDLCPASTVVHDVIMVVSCLCLVVHLFWVKGWFLSQLVSLVPTWRTQWC